MLQRAYSTLELKAVDGDGLTIAGVASTPETDRVGDIIVPEGITFKNPAPLLLYHNSSKPVGTVRFDKPTKDGLTFTAKLIDPSTIQSASLKDRVLEAIESVRHKLLRGVSIGFRPLNDAIDFMQDTGGLRFREIEVMELSLVAIPANASAGISEIKSICAGDRAVSGEGHRAVVRISAGDTGHSRTDKAMAKTIQEQISAFETARQAKSARMNEIQTKAAEEGRTKTAEEKQEFDTLREELKSIDDELVDLRAMEEVNKAAARPVQGSTPHEAAASRAHRPSIAVSDNIPKGIGFARYTIAAVAARKNGSTIEAVAKQRWPDHGALHQFIQKATIPGALTTNSDWLGNLVDPTNLASEFVEYLRPATIVGKFGMGNIPSLRRLPFNIRITGQTTGAVANWVGQGKPKPVTSFATNAQTLLYTKIAAIAVLPQEVIRFSTPSAEALVRDELKRAVVERMDIDFVDPAHAAVANVNPASITNGLSAMSSAGTSEANVRTDITALLAAFIEQNVDVSGLVLIMPNTLSMALSIMTNSLGQPAFPGMSITGGTLLGIPVIASQYAGNQSGYGNMVIAVNANDIGLADDGEVTIDASTEASIQMSDAPTNDAATGTGQSLVSMFQTNSVAVLAERFVNWGKLRSNAVVYMDDVNWGSVGSPS